MKSKIDLQEKLDELYERAESLSDPSDEYGINSAERDAVSFLLGDGDSITDKELPVPANDADIDVLINTLEAEKKGIPERSLFGDPNWKATDAQIAICRWAKGK